MIYCVEDDRGIRELIVYTLRNSGFDADGFESGGAFMNRLYADIRRRELLRGSADQQSGKSQSDLVLLDIMLPGEDGLSILSSLRSSPESAAVPVIMITAKGTEYDRVVGLDGGADDYITKPFGMTELMARIKAVLRRCSDRGPGGLTEAESVLICGTIRMNTGSRVVTVDGKTVYLTRREFELLQMFLRSPGIVLTRETLLEHVWGYENIGETRTVDVHVRTLRQKLGSEGACIETVRGIGYRSGEPV
ncbi:MAG: response regulator transcription factor [Spirochaetaceae bacterium]|jgi:two-component system alkaline phosphatase synthesis response regulator PhoP|nr:response regulator transcription factor [Spirochaetaceae bacterium]